MRLKVTCFVTVPDGYIGQSPACAAAERLFEIFLQHGGSYPDTVKATNLTVEKTAHPAVDGEDAGDAAVFNEVKYGTKT